MSAFLGSHSRIAIPAVGSNMWTYFYRQYGDLADCANLERCLTAMLSYKHVRFLDPDPQRIREQFSAGPPTYARLFSLFLEQFAETAGKPRWGAQTGLVERYGDELIEAYPGIRIVHMYRDPRDRFLASIERWPDGRGRAGGATARWLYSTRLGERHLARYPDQYLMVRFEDLITRTEETLRSVCEFVGESYEPSMTDMSAAAKHRARLSEGSSAPGEVLTSDHIGRYRGRVCAAELAFIQLHAGRVMAAHGYEIDDLEMSRTDRLRFALLTWPDQLLRLAAWRGVEALQQRFPRAVGRRPGARMIVEPV